MRTILGRLVIRSKLLGCVASAAAIAAAAPTGVETAASVEWKVGSARVAITPEKNMWMAGYASRKKPAEGVVQDLHAKALALEDAQGTRLVIVTMDLIGVIPSLRQAVEKQVGERFGLRPESLLLNASHTHSGPEYRIRPGREEEARDYTAVLETKLVEVVRLALEALAPARLSWSHARCGFAMNRRRDYTLPANHPNADRAPNPDGPVDHDVPVLRIDDPVGQLRAVLFGYACHNTCLSFFQFCGDYAGYAQEYLEANRSGVTAHFLLGAGGDQNPYPRGNGAVPGKSDLDLAKSHGQSLANAVEVGLTVNPRPIHSRLGLAYAPVPLDYEKRERPAHAYPVQLVRLGDELTLVALGSEVVVDYSLRIKRELGRTGAVWVAGYSNDYSGYIPSRRVLREGGYEADEGWADSVEDRIMSQVLELDRRLRSPRP